MADSPLKDTDGPISIQVISGDRRLPDDVEIISIDIRAACNAIPKAKIVIADGNIAENTFPLTDAKTVAPGATIEIRAAYGDHQEQELFVGIVFAACLSVSAQNGPRLCLTCEAKACVLLNNSGTGVHEAKSDSDIMSDVLAEAGLKSDVTATDDPASDHLRPLTSDWDYLKMLAQRHELVLFVNNDHVTITRPDVSQSAKLTATLGQDIIDFEGEITRNQLHSLVDGRVSYQGTAKVVPGDVIELKGVGDRLGGKAFANAVTHKIEAGAWITTLDLGLPEIRDTAAIAPPLSITAPLYGHVKKIYEDPEDGKRIKVSLPDHEAEIWARFAVPYATKDAGIQFLPEVGDEVLVDFVQGNPADAVVIGTLHNKKAKRPFEATEENAIKAIKTKSGLLLQFDDDKKIAMLQTPGGQSVTLDDDAKSLALKDMNGNAIVMDETGIKIESTSDITMTAAGDTSISSVKNATISSGGNATLAGGNVSVSADMEVAVTGNASAEISASGQTTVKGSMVMIN